MNPPRKKIHFLCRCLTGLLTLFLVIATAAPLLHTDTWWVRIFDFPRIQIAVLIALVLGAYVALRIGGPLRKREYVLGGMAGLALVWQIVSIAPYTAIYPREMAQSPADKNANRVSLLVFNVLVENRKSDNLLELIRETEPDIILLSEPTQWWLEQLQGLKEDYPHTLFQPQENHYGMLLYSKLELENPEVRFLIEPEVPSMRAQVRLRSGELMTLYGVHPRPPGLKPPDSAKQNKGSEEDDETGEREDSDVRDAELLLIAKEVKKAGDVPVIVAGDFNDVAWSHTTHLFQRVGGLLDPRIGRGLFNTFDTRSRLLRYPLDHVFASRHFLLVELRRLPHIGSDHFPMLVTLDYNPEKSAQNEMPRPDAADEHETQEAIEEGLEEDEENSAS